MENHNAAISSIGSITSCDIDKWIDSKYEPLPTMVEVARRFWNGEELPNIKQVHAETNLDEPRMTKSYGTKSSGRTEPSVLIQLCDEKLEWCVFLILVGEALEIDMPIIGWVEQKLISCRNINLLVEVYQTKDGKL